MTYLFKNLGSFNAIKISVRYKNSAQHWSVLKKKKSNSQKALDHFNEFYGNVYGNSWKSIRSSLLSKTHKYIAIVNNYSDTKRIYDELEYIGAINMKNIYNVNKTIIESNKKSNINNVKSDEEVDCISIEKEIENYKVSDQYSEDLSNMDSIENKNDEPFVPIELQSIEKDVTISTNDNRIIKSSIGIPASQLFDFIPATKIKGMDDFVLESDHYNYYNKAADFSVKIEQEDTLNFPDMLSIYTFEEDSKSKFPAPKVGSIGFRDYFTLDSASVLPVLSLDLQPKDYVLDMCAGPGGKTLIILQTLCPFVTVANDVEMSRVKRVKSFVNQFIPYTEDNSDKFILTKKDARYVTEQNVYNKILVDVPCTTDRHVLHTDDNNIFKSSRIKERLQLPELQTEILVNALKLVTCGGTVVYSTCTLSPIQNDGVVQVALQKVFEEFNIVFVIKDQLEALAPLRYLYKFGNFGLKYGHLVVPTKAKNCGPMYFCKMVRIQ